MMNRRHFLKHSSKLLIGAGIAGSVSRCKDLHDFYSNNGELNNGITWSNFQLAVDLGSEGTYDTTFVSHPTVIKNGSSYKMWYTGISGANRIIYCESTNGIIWSNFQLAINIGSEGTWDTAAANTACVIKVGDGYKMWYIGRTGPTNWKMIYCTSADGINWSNHRQSINNGSQGVYDALYVVNPTVIKDGSSYKMWYSGNDGTNNRVIYCESSDCINWSNYQLSLNIGSHGIYDTDGISNSCVIKDGSIYKMWYAGSDGANTRIIYCESVDGVNWTNHQLSVNIGSQGTYDTTIAGRPAVINVNGVGKMWYTAKDGANFRILYCESY